jgi:hypothetical protein
MVRQKKSQSASEYLIVMGIVMFVIIATFIIYFQYSEQNQLTVSTAQADRLAKKIVDAAEEVYYLGKPSRNTIQVYMPASVHEIVISPNEFNVRVKTVGGITDIETKSNVPLTGSISATQGVKYIELTATDTNVCVVERGGNC